MLVVFSWPVVTDQENLREFIGSETFTNGLLGDGRHGPKEMPDNSAPMDSRGIQFRL
jgi:hypothetical protein